jgi:hypothetical protein
MLFQIGPKPNILVTIHSLLRPRFRHLPLENCFRNTIPHLEYSFRGLAIKQGLMTFRRPIVATFLGGNGKILDAILKNCF